MPERLRHLLGIEPLTAAQINFVLDEAKPFQEIQRHPLKKLATLRGKSVALAFFENSTRTRISFATAASRLGADTLNLQAESSSLKKGESLLDTVRTLDAMKPDCIVMRHASSGACEFVARHLDIPVINAGDGCARASHAGAARCADHPRPAGLARKHAPDDPRRHPAQPRGALESAAAEQIRRAASRCAARRCGCRANSSRWACACKLTSRIDEALEGADVVIVLRVQEERMHEPALPLAEYILRYQLTPERLRRAKPNALVLHPGPMIRGLEIDPAVADGPQSCVLEQVTNGLAVRMALLFMLMNPGTRIRFEQRDPTCCGLAMDA